MADFQISVRRIYHCCRVCSKALRKPVTIPCGHNFCKSCIRACWDNEERSSPLYTCPECRCIFFSRPQLIDNTTLAELVRDTEVRMGAGKRPWSCTGTGTSEGTGSRRHGTPLNLFPGADEQVHDVGCAADGRRAERVSEEGKQKQEELKNLRAKSKQILLRQEEEMKKMKQSLEQIQERARETDDHCESIMAGLIDSLQRHYGSVRELIGAQERAAEAQVHRSIQTLQLKMEDMKKRDAELDRLEQTESSVHFLQKLPSLSRLSEKDTSHLDKFLEDSLLPFQSIKRDVELFGKQLEAFCDNKFTEISHTGDRGEQRETQEERAEDAVPQTSGFEASVSQSRVCIRLPGLSAVTSKLTGPPAEPKTRAEFLQYACELSLDPTTAHDDLLVSNGDKEVKLCPTTWRSPGGRHPERFVHRRQVLCREGLWAERCYYEVEVHGGKAEIALAYKGMDRKSRRNLSAFGGNKNSWSLDRARNYSVSHRADSIQLTTTPACRRIGVYLKFKEGTLAFYEVSDTMEFLYQIEAEFTEPLYPGFWLGEKCCIRLCDLSRARL